MDDLQSQLDDLSSNVDDLSSTTDDQGNTLDDHESRIGTVEDTTSAIDPQRINQLNYPLDQDSIDLIQNAVGGFILSGLVTLASGTYTITDNRIKATSSIVTTSQSAHLTSAICSTGSAVITGTGTDIINYVIFI